MKLTPKQQAEALMNKASVMSRSFDQLYDKAESAAKEAQGHAEEAERAKKFCKLAAESVHRTYMRDMWWKVLLMVTIVADIALNLFVLLRT